MSLVKEQDQETGIDALCLNAETYDWTHALLYLHLESATGKTETIREGGQRRLLVELARVSIHLFVVFILAITFDKYMSIDETALTTISIFIFNSLLLFFIVYPIVRLFKELEGFRKSIDFETNYPSVGDCVELYRITLDGVFINRYNRKELESSFEWKDVKEVQFVRTSRPRKDKVVHGVRSKDELAMKSSLRRCVEEIKERYPSYPYKEDLCLKDEIGLAFTMNNNQQNVLPILEEWKKDERLEQFMQVIKEKVGPIKSLEE